MTDKTARPNDAASGEPEAEAAPAAAEIDPAARLAQEAADLRDKLLRTLAEMENLRRRTEREVGDARAYGIANFARDVLGVADNMQRAIQTLDPGLRTSDEPGVKALLDGVELTERELLKALEKHGVRKFDPQGEKFDPHLHQAVFEIPDEAKPTGTVAQVVQSGYMIGERVLRPAMVGVTRGGPKAAASESPANDNADAE